MFGIDYDDVYRVVKTWKPAEQFSKEKEYRDNLIEYLRDKLNDEDICEYGTVYVSPEKGRGLCDIAINENRIGIELKNDLNSKSKIDRLVGQVHRYKKDYHNILIVLVGKTKKNSFDDLSVQIKALNKDDDFYFDDRYIKIIDKGN